MIDKPSSRDFDFLHGEWRVAHRRLTERLAGSSVWQSFTGTCEVNPTLGGLGNVDDNVLEFPGGTYRAVSLRSFDALTGEWAIWWLDARDPHAIGVPVIGQFQNGEGTFFAKDTFHDRPIVVRFRWSDLANGEPQWEQAFSDDDGDTWEVNWIMRFQR